MAVVVVVCVRADAVAGVRRCACDVCVCWRRRLTVAVCLWCGTNDNRCVGAWDVCSMAIGVWNGDCALAQPAQLSAFAGLKATFVLRYHPIFQRAFAHALEAAPPPKEMGLTIRAAWKNALP